MNLEKQSLIARSLDDILSQAERIINGFWDKETLENFSQYSKELTKFFKENITSSAILERVEKIPAIEMGDNQSFLSKIFLFDIGGRVIDRDKQRYRKKIE